MTRRLLFAVGLIVLLASPGAAGDGAAQEFTVNTHRVDPYKQFKFRVLWDGRAVPGIWRVSGLVRTTEVLQFRQGGEPNVIHRSPGTTAYEPIRLHRGRTHDPTFEAWANLVESRAATSGAEVALAAFRKDIRIELMNEAGQVVMAFNVYRCWPSQYIALDELEARAPGSMAGEVLTLQCEGWERDQAVVEPVEPR